MPYLAYISTWYFQKYSSRGWRISPSAISHHTRISRYNNYYSHFLTSTLISENGILTSTKSKTTYLLSQTIKNHLPTSISKGYMPITCHHKTNRSKDTVIKSILIGDQYYSNMLIIPDKHPSDFHANINNYMQYALLHDSEFAQLCNK